MRSGLHARSYCCCSTCIKISPGVHRVIIPAGLKCQCTLYMGICGFLHSEKVSMVAQTMCTLCLCLLLLLLQSLQ